MICECHKIEDEIRRNYPKCNWNLDKACKEWNKRKDKLVDNNIRFAPYSDECFACTCPTCGRIVCGWCV